MITLIIFFILFNSIIKVIIIIVKENFHNSVDEDNFDKMFF